MTRRAGVGGVEHTSAREGDEEQAENEAKRKRPVDKHVHNWGPHPVSCVVQVGLAIKAVT